MRTYVRTHTYKYISTYIRSTFIHPNKQTMKAKKGIIVILEIRYSRSEGKVKILRVENRWEGRVVFERRF